MKKFRLPVWLPYPSSWLSALILSLLMTGFVATLRRTDSLKYYLVRWSDRPELFTVCLILLLISPIPAIAFFHHFVLSRFIRTIPGERINKTQGFFPGLISWWESLYSWLVLVLSTLIATLFFTPFLPLFKLNYEKIFNTASQTDKNTQAIFALSWLISAAILYQIQYLVKSRLVFGDPLSNELESTKDIELESQQDNNGVTEIQTTDQSPTQKPTAVNFFAKHQKLPKKIFTLVLIPLVALWIYLFANKPEVREIRQNISTNITLKNQSAVTSETAPEDDTFQQAINKAKRAARLTNSAQSQDEWKIVVSRWEEAIEIMETVPVSSPDYAIAQQKIIQYQTHRDFAKQNTVGGELWR